ncbi:Retrovirus-related Pol polyprotein from transposon RE1 (Retro element 1) (AtRE1) [Includes: Protease RE1 [Durusdinium trenchii]|uniref:Retrovirus-related Pol polyprotein from transposon RE1 (Retro element 1) (AtRE1) n=1 Tax=Durusdinium trenchii TaxID=1381693 RepID=A0ABP0P7C7_9DINO
MSQLLERTGRLMGDREKNASPADVVMKGQARRPKMALKNWRVVLDKLFIIMAFVERQALVKEWLPSLALSELFTLQSKQEDDSLEAIYAKIITTAKPLAPLKSKEKPTVSASSCIHPKNQLKGGGNKTASYVTCKMCHSRWESPLQASEIKEDLKKQKQGLLSQTKTALTLKKKEEAVTEKDIDPQGAAVVQNLQQLLREEREQAASQKMEVMKELEQQRLVMREKEVQMQAMMSSVMNQKEAVEKMLEEKSQSSQEYVKVPMKTEGPLGEEPLCHCQLIAYKLRWLAEEGSTKKERHFWVCKTGQCEYFQWEDKRVTQIPSEMTNSRRIAAQAGKDGLRQGSSFDLITGWDLSNEADRKKMWRALKEEDPILLILCPPCTAFSARQSLNFPRMDKGKVAVMIQTGMEHLELAMALAKWQHRRGRYFLFEHPASASSWKEATVEEVESLEGVEVVSTDMCMYGMNVNGVEAEEEKEKPVLLKKNRKLKTLQEIKKFELPAKEQAMKKLEPEQKEKLRCFWWKGVTEFKLHSKKEEKNQEKIEVWAVANASGGGNLSQEVDLSKEDEKDLEEWKVEDKSEFDKIQRSKAIEVLSPEESRKIREELRKEGKEDRILPSRMARRYKPAEQPGVPPSKKSRLCIRGDKDPDILELDRFSPTVNTMNLNVMLQIAINAGMTISIGDLKSAFCQSDPLERANGPLYFRQPSEGISGLHPEQICKIVAGCYGLVDAPLHWRKTLLKALGKLGFKESRLDPCIYKLYEEGRLMGLLAIEVDDILACGKGKFHEKMKQLRSQFTFGKCVNLKEEKEGASFNGRRLRQDEEGTLHIDMQKFIEERLEEIPIDKERKKEKKEEVNERERTQARAVCGSLNWLSKEGRPDAAGPSSLMSSRLTTMKVEDLCCLNEVIKQLKNSSNLCLKVQPLTKMRLAVITDASFGNDGFHSQGRQMIVAHEEGLQEGRKVKANLLWWRSAKLQRVVNSTLAAETQSLSKGMGDLLWMKVLFKELEEEKFNMYDWPSSLAKEEVVAMATCENGELQRCLAIVDAKSLFDYLSKQTIGGQDKRTAIEIQIIRQELAALNGEIRWIDHPAMVADCLTKVKGSTDPLFSFLRSGCFCIAAEEEHLKKRKEDRSLGISNAQIRAGVNKSLGSCKNGMSSMSTP